MLIKCFHLSVQTNRSKTIADAELKAKAWAPASAKACTLKVIHTDYHGAEAEKETGYATVLVWYYTKANEGKLLLTSIKSKGANMSLYQRAWDELNRTCVDLPGDERTIADLVNYAQIQLDLINEEQDGTEDDDPKPIRRWLAKWKFKSEEK